MSENNKYVDVILPLALPQLFTYQVPEEMIVFCEKGKRVVVQFGKKKLYSALIRKVHSEKPKFYETKDILSIIDQEPIITEKQFALWEWVSEYYMCTIGEVYKAAIPAGMKLESETMIFFNENADIEEVLSEKEQIIINNLKEKKSLKINEINKFLDQKNVMNILNLLIEKNIISVEEKLKKNYKTKKEDYIKLSTKINSEEDLKNIFNNLSNAPKQLALLINYIQYSEIDIEHPKSETKEIKKTEILKKTNTSSSVLEALVEKKIFEIYSKEIGRITEEEKELKEIYQLSEAQNIAYQNIKTHFAKNKNVLLFGVTSSGKTEIYIHLIKEALEKGKQILYLLPEIAITSQIINRLKSIFGNKVGIYHSKFSDAERVEIWNNINTSQFGKEPYQIILGVRSSIFLPFNNLGLIIVDEEHESTFKQYDPAPRYHARDLALVLGSMQKANVLLGTATPSLETFYNSKVGKFEIVELKQRHKNIKLPEIVVSDIKEAARKKQMKSIFSPLLLENIKSALENNEQVILFQNRRGFSPYLECKTCSWIPKCENCDVSLTYHKNINELVCHYCGFRMPSPSKCLACGDTAMETKGFGTEKIEDEIKMFFPNAKIGRMDHDTTKAKNSHERIISDFELKKIDILIGTQMVSKGLDFENVRIVGIMNADNLLNFPNFRSFERSFQLMVQVSGRAGRKGNQGKVIVQTSNPKHIIIKSVVENNYDLMVRHQLLERKKFKYPPYYKLIKIILKHKNLNKLEKSAEVLGNYLRQIFGERVLGPEFPLINRIQTWYIKEIMIKIEKEKSIKAAKEIILDAVNRLKNVKEYSGIQININVDPF